MGLELLTRLAFLMYSNKGAYKLLLGSGISKDSNIDQDAKWKIFYLIIFLPLYINRPFTGFFTFIPIML